MGRASKPGTVRLAVPAKSKYVGLARLAAVAVCRLTPLSPEAVADLKLAIGEAAGSWIGPPARPGEDEPEHSLRFRFALERERLLVDLSCSGPERGSEDERELARTIIEATVDECHLEPGSVCLVKYLADSPQ